MRKRITCKEKGLLITVEKGELGLDGKRTGDSGLIFFDGLWNVAKKTEWAEKE